VESRFALGPNDLPSFVSRENNFLASSRMGLGLGPAQDHVSNVHIYQWVPAARLCVRTA